MHFLLEVVLWVAVWPDDSGEHEHSNYIWQKDEGMKT